MSQGQGGQDPLDTGGFFEELGEVPREIAQRGEFYAAMLERQAEIISQLTQLRRQVGGPGSGFGSDTPGFARLAPESLIHIETEAWTLDSANPISASTDTINVNTLSSSVENVNTQTIVSAESTDNDVLLDVLAVGSTVHLADTSETNRQNSVVEYRYQYQSSPGGNWKTVPGMVGSWPHGRLDDPKPPIPAAALGPVYGFRIRYHNITSTGAFISTDVPDSVQRSAIIGRAYSAERHDVDPPS